MSFSFSQFLFNQLMDESDTKFIKFLFFKFALKVLRLLLNEMTINFSQKFSIPREDVNFLEFNLKKYD